MDLPELEEVNENETGSLNAKKLEHVPEETVARANIGVPIIYKYVMPPIDFGFISPDPYMSRYLKIARDVIFENNDVEYCFEHKVKILARIVCSNITLSKQYIKHWQHGYEVHQEELKRRLGTNIVPIGYVRIGAMCERALLFKVLADRLSIPCTLVRGEHYVYYNEVFLVNDIAITGIDSCVGDTEKEQRFHCIVDLMERPGALMKMGSEEANDYVEAKMKPEMSREQAEYIHTFCLE